MQWSVTLVENKQDRPSESLSVNEF